MPIDYPRLPVAFMNDDHDHAAEQIEAMLAALPTYPGNREPLSQACRAFLEHNRTHFAREETAMRASGFPPFPVHKGEHDRILGWLENLVTDIEAGLDPDAINQAVGHDIPAWFVQHVRTMDFATAAWIAAHEPASGVRV